MVLPAVVPAAIGAGAIGAGATGAGAGAFGSAFGPALLSVLSAGLVGGLKGRGEAATAKEQKRRTRAEFLANLLKQQQEESLGARQMANYRTAQQGNALQELANGFRASLTGR